MTSFLSKIFSKSKILLAIAGIFLVVFVGFLHINMMGMNGAMFDCPLMPGGAICTMTPLEHAAVWQQMFTAMPHNETLLQILFLLCTVGFCFIYLRRFFSPPKNIFSRIQKRTYRTRIFPTLFLGQAFARGILNPKTF